MAKNINIVNEIQKLKSEGLNQNQIRLRLKCSSATVYYHWSESNKNKINKVNKKWKKDNSLKKKLSDFIYATTLQYNNRLSTYKIKLNARLCKKISNFKTTAKSNGESNMIHVDEVKKLIEENPYCYLTGRKIDINDTKSYHFDHKLPVSRGGDASLENLGIACREANQAKNDMTTDEFIQLCKEVLLNNGYNVSKTCEEHEQ